MCSRLNDETKVWQNWILCYKSIIAEIPILWYTCMTVIAEMLFLWYMAVIAEIHYFYVYWLHGRNTLLMIYCCYSRNTFFLCLLTAWQKYSFMIYCCHSRNTFFLCLLTVVADMLSFYAIWPCALLIWSALFFIFRFLMYINHV